jgi:hypothetical protein
LKIVKSGQKLVENGFGRSDEQKFLKIGQNVRK